MRLLWLDSFYVTSENWSLNGLSIQQVFRALLKSSETGHYNAPAKKELDPSISGSMYLYVNYSK